MSDLYLEELDKKKETGTDQALRYVLMALTAIGVVLSLLNLEPDHYCGFLSAICGGGHLYFSRDFRQNGNISMSTGNWMWIVS